MSCPRTAEGERWDILYARGGVGWSGEGGAVTHHVDISKANRKSFVNLIDQAYQQSRLVTVEARDASTSKNSYD